MTLWQVSAPSLPTPTFASPTWNAGSPLRVRREKNYSFRTHPHPQGADCVPRRQSELTANDRQRQLARILVDAGADAVIGGHPHVTQDIEHYQGKPIVCSVGNFVMKETDNNNQRRGWVLRLKLDRQGVSGFDTRVAQISFDGIPTLDRLATSPCWKRGDSGVGLCRGNQHTFACIARTARLTFSGARASAVCARKSRHPPSVAIVGCGEFNCRFRRIAEIRLTYLLSR